MSDIDDVLFDLAYQQGKSVSECLYDVYNKGRADAIEEVIRLINSKHATINYSEQTDIHTITIYQRDTKWLKEQLKEQNE